MAIWLKYHKLKTSVKTDVAAATFDPRERRTRINSFASPSAPVCFSEKTVRPRLMCIPPGRGSEMLSPSGIDDVMWPIVYIEKTSASDNQWSR